MNEFPVVVIGASTGALEAVRQIIERLPPDCGAGVALVMHVGAHPSHLADILKWYAPLPVSFGQDGETFMPGHVYIAPSDLHMRLVPPGCIQLDRGAKLHFTRPAVDPLFASAAATFGRRTIGIILGGEGTDGAEGLRAIRARGGVALVQDPREAAVREMPEAAIAGDGPEIVPTRQLARRVASFCSSFAERRGG
ncbi:MAG: chemotaxis protein CheB [Reyranella sp.]|nr:MAG: chemotaxis protein CheB [Reyranella sp.]